jgi:hypothetical protein
MALHVLEIASEADKDRVYQLVTTRLADRRWVRGDSGLQEAWHVSTLDLPGTVRIWGFEDKPGSIFVDIRDEGPDLPEDELAHWRRHHIERVVATVLELGPPRSASDDLHELLAELGRRVDSGLVDGAGDEPGCGSADDEADGS